jgi:serine phosphatase RsbU (regulator of sigma subunit)
MNRNTYILLTLLFFFKLSIEAQNSKLDSLIHEVSKPQKDTIKIKLYLSISFYASKISPDSGIYYCNKALELAKTCDFKKGMASACYNIGLYNQYKANYYNNNLFGEKALKIYEELGNKKKMYDCYNLIGNGYSAQGNLQKALEFHFKSLKGRENIKDTNGVALSLMNIGRVFRTQNDYKKAIDYYNRALDLSIKQKMDRSIANCLNNIGNVYYYQQKYDTALLYQFKSLKVNLASGDEDAVNTNYSNIGGINIYIHKYDSAIKYYTLAMSMAKEKSDYMTIANCYEGFATIYLEKKEYNKAIENFNKTLQIVKERGILEYISSAYKNLSEVYALNKNYREAFEAQKNYKLYYDSIFNQNNTKKLTETSLKYEFEKQQEHEKEENLRKELVQSEKSKNQQTLIYVFSIGFIIVLILLFISIRNYKQKQKINNELESKNIVIEEKNRDITDSIKYAKRLQDAILPTSQIISSCFKNAFVLFKPKDIVSGDFYWMEKIGNEVFFAVVDCTGHGVPGAFMSIMAHNLIQQAIHEKQLKNPSEILNYINISLNETLHNQDLNKVNDGMDLALCVFDTKTNSIKYAGANNPLWIINKEGELIEITPDKTSIGFQNTISFNQKFVQLENGSMIYLFSDGYADQFGGDNGKKLMKKTLKKLLCSVSNLEIDEQQIALENKLNEWKGNLQQVDDVCVLGIRV